MLLISFESSCRTFNVNMETNVSHYDVTDFSSHLWIWIRFVLYVQHNKAHMKPRLYEDCFEFAE